jgi:hypothetical protein
VKIAFEFDELKIFEEIPIFWVVSNGFAGLQAFIKNGLIAFNWEMVINGKI